MEDDEHLAFKDFNLDFRLLKAVAKLGWEKPTLIQEKAIPLFLEGKDIIARAKTGSGKTGAFAIPLIQKVVEAKQGGGGQGVQAVIMAPTKELAAQICVHVNNLAQFVSGEVTTVDLIKTANLVAQKLMLQSQPDILVGTPTVLLEQLRGGNLVLKDTLQFFVLDEADLLLSFGYEDDLKEILGYLPAIYQAFLTSATLNAEITALKSLILHNPVVLKLHESQLPSSSQLTQYLMSCTEEDKFVIICAIFKLKLIKGKTIIFVQSIDRCFRLKMFLGYFSVPAIILNSELPVNSRLHIVDQFNRDLYSILIACDEVVLENPAHKKSKQALLKFSEKESSVSRGIDFTNVSNVVNFDFPKTVEEYVHRVGRTARAWNQGNALSFSTDRDGKCVARVKKVLSKQLGDANFLRPYRINMAELDCFRYRCSDALRSVTSFAVREARLKEIKAEIMKSEKLKTYFAKNPGDLELIRHDRTVGVCKSLQHLKHVPEYIVPQSLRGTRVMSSGMEYRQSRSERPKRLTYHQKKNLKRKADPLECFEDS